MTTWPRVCESYCTFARRAYDHVATCVHARGRRRYATRHLRKRPAAPFLGIAKGYLPFDQALRYARALKLNSSEEWKTWASSGARPPDIPSSPESFYKLTGWQGFGHWLGASNTAGLALHGANTGTGAGTGTGGLRGVGHAMVVGTLEKGVGEEGQAGAGAGAGAGPCADTAAQGMRAAAAPSLLAAGGRGAHNIKLEKVAPDVPEASKL